MKFKVHFTIQAVAFVLVCTFLGLRAALLIILFHFIPSLDFAMKKLNVRPDLHRKLTHNLFVFLIATLLALRFAPRLWALLASSNLILHLLMDCQGNGVELFYPLSEYRVKLY